MASELRRTPYLSAIPPSVSPDRTVCVFAPAGALSYEILTRLRDRDGSLIRPPEFLPGEAAARFPEVLPGAAAVPAATGYESC